MSSIERLGLPQAERVGGPGLSFTRTLGKVQRGLPAHEAQRLYEIPGRETRRRELALGVARLRDAARTLSESEPRADSTAIRTETQQTPIESAKAAVARSVSFASSDEIVADKNSLLELELGSGDSVQVQVTGGGASLSDLAELINTDSENDGDLVASVVSSGGGYRLEITTTETGSSATLTVLQDDFKDPGSGPDFQLLDPGQAADGLDANERTVVETETSERAVDDEAFAARVAELAQAFDALRALVAEGGEASRAGDAQAIRVREALDTLAASLEERRSDSGARLADAGVSLDDAGRLQIDTERFQGAIARDTRSVVELLVAAHGGLAGDVSRALEPASPEPADPTRDLSGFVRGLASTETRVEERIALLENVVVSLAGSAG